MADIENDAGVAKIISEYGKENALYDMACALGECFGRHASEKAPKTWKELKSKMTSYIPGGDKSGWEDEESMVPAKAWETDIYGDPDEDDY